MKYHTLLIPVCLVSAAATTAKAQGTPPDYGFTWRTIGDAGNRSSLSSELPGWRSIGAVPYEFRIMQTNLSEAQYLEFVNAYAPYWHGNPADFTLTGRFIVPVQQPGGEITYQLRDDAIPNSAADMSWQMAARFCNWLQNGKGSQQSAFETGAYDTSAFHFDGPDVAAQLVHLPGAQYWIPSLDEATKACYYDPNRYGQGQGGYWLYPNMTNSPLIQGLPGEGGQTIGELLWNHDDPGPPYGTWPLGQYPEVQSPWGLIDISATIPFYTSTLYSEGSLAVAKEGSMAGDPAYVDFDRGDFFMIGSLVGTQGTLRIASLVPAPSSCIALTFLAFCVNKRSRT